MRTSTLVLAAFVWALAMLGPATSQPVQASRPPDRVLQDSPSSDESATALPEGVYRPVILLGNEHAPARLVFAWGSNQRSAEIFKYYILPIVSNPERANKLKVILTQYFLPDKIDVHGPGALIFCGDRTQYAQIALDYLRAGYHLDARQRMRGDIEKNFFGNPTILDDLKINKVDLRHCLLDQSFYKRVAFVIGLTGRMRHLAHFSNLPLIVFQGKVVSATDQVGLQNIERLTQ